jgi:glycosyltransferase involved in cell wall biosynthesis
VLPRSVVPWEAQRGSPPRVAPGLSRRGARVSVDSIIGGVRLLIVADGIPNRDPEWGDGSSMISFEVIKAMPAWIAITLVVLGSTHDVPAEIAERCDRVVTFGIRRHGVALVRSLFSRLQVSAEERSVGGVRRCVRELSAENDVTLLHGPHIPFLAREVRGPMVLQAVDPWSMRMEMEARLSSGLLGAYRKFKARRVLALERSIPAGARVLTVGREDASRWSALLHREVRGIANGVDQAERVPRRSGAPVVCFTGSLNYAPNVQSAIILIEQVAPLVWRDLPETRFVIAGRQPDRAVLDLRGPRVEVRANVPSMADVFDAADVAVFPDREGLGIRNSVQEALASGIPVVATRVAAREAADDESLTVADGAEAIAANVLRLLHGSGAAGGARGTSSAAERSWKTATDDYVDEFERARAGSL